MTSEEVECLLNVFPIRFFIAWNRVNSNVLS